MCAPIRTDNDLFLGQCGFLMQAVLVALKLERQILIKLEKKNFDFHLQAPL